MLPETIADRAAIGDVMLKYAAGVDERDLKLYRSCFADNVEILIFGSQTYSGYRKLDRIRLVCTVKIPGDPTYARPPLITQDGDKASVRTDVQALHYLKEGNIKTFIL
jgi:hypothetical protein